jgi:hypothetical protein
MCEDDPLSLFLSVFTILLSDLRCQFSFSFFQVEHEDDEPDEDHDQVGQQGLRGGRTH